MILQKRNGNYQERNISALAPAFGHFVWPAVPMPSCFIFL